MALIFQHVFTNHNGARTVRISPELSAYQGQLEEISRFHETDVLGDKGFVYFPLPEGSLFVLGQAASFPVPDRTAYVQHNLILDEEAFTLFKSQAPDLIRRIAFYENLTDVPAVLPDLSVCPLTECPPPPLPLPALNWEAMAEAMLLGFISNWRFRRTTAEAETLARMILARLFAVLPLEILRRARGFHTSAFPQISAKITIRFPYRDNMRNAILYIDDSPGGPKANGEKNGAPPLYAILAKHLRENQPLTAGEERRFPLNHMAETPKEFPGQLSGRLSGRSSGRLPGRSPLTVLAANRFAVKLARGRGSPPLSFRKAFRRNFLVRLLTALLILHAVLDAFLVIYFLRR
ncbi:MAG: hypothetical protein LBT44_02185 [Clostridiales bacterium]|jgi:hypothetical protein|nr:hypothetical protein [Clostridiales bacterium]